MKILLTLTCWMILFILCWPLAFFVLFAWPVVWLLSIPFRIVGALIGGIVSLLAALFSLPARLLGQRV